MAVVDKGIAPHRGEFLSDAGGFGELKSRQFQFSVEFEPSYEKTYSGVEKDERVAQDLGPRLPHFTDYLYFHELARLPLLSPEEEIDLGKGIFEGKRRIRMLLLRYPVELAWIAKTAKRMEKGEIQPREVMEVFGVGTKMSESELRKRFMFCAKEVLEFGVQGYCAGDNLDASKHEEYSIMEIHARKRTLAESPSDGNIPNAEILAQLDGDLRKRANPLARSLHGSTAHCQAASSKDSRRDKIMKHAHIRKQDNMSRKTSGTDL